MIEDSSKAARISVARPRLELHLLPLPSSCWGPIQPGRGPLPSPCPAAAGPSLDPGPLGCPGRSLALSRGCPARPGPAQPLWQGGSRATLSPPRLEGKSASWAFPRFLTCVFPEACQLSRGLTRCQHSNLVTDWFNHSFLLL